MTFSKGSMISKHSVIYFNETLLSYPFQTAKKCKNWVTKLELPPFSLWQPPVRSWFQYGTSHNQYYITVTPNILTGWATGTAASSLTPTDRATSSEDVDLPNFGPRAKEYVEWFLRFDRCCGPMDTSLRSNVPGPTWEKGRIDTNLCYWQ